MKLVVTGTRCVDRNLRSQARVAMKAFFAKHGYPTLIILGDQTGVDEYAWEFAGELRIRRFRVKVYPELGSPQKFHDRNQRMADMARSGDYVLALPIPDKSRGTWDCLRRCVRNGLIQEVRYLYLGRNHAG